MEITTVGIDSAKNVFQIHGVNGRGKCLLRKRLRRDQMALHFAKDSLRQERRKPRKPLPNGSKRESTMIQVSSGTAE